MVILTVTRYGQHNQFTYATVAAAASAACTGVETNEAAPVSIQENGVVIWKNTGPFDGSYDKLYELSFDQNKIRNGDENANSR